MLMNCFAIDHKVFRKLLYLFKPVFNTHMLDDKTGRIRQVALTKHGRPKGRKRDIDATGCLGLVLYWYCSRVCGKGNSHGIWSDFHINVQMDVECAKL